MNYIKILKAPEKKLEATLNGFLKEVHEKGHRVMNIRFFNKPASKVTVYVLLHSEPHPHWQREKPQMG